MGSVWCKPSEMRQDCSPKLNIHSLISRLSTQMCPSKCRYPQTASRSRTKPRPRSTVLSQGKRPEISPPLVQPVPPPRKKRKRLQDISRSEEILCPQELLNSTLRTSTSLPSVYDLNGAVVLMNVIDIKAPLESIKEEITIAEQKEINETETESLPPSDVYFLKKEEIPVVFSEAKSVTDITENNDYLNNKKPMNDTFTGNNELPLPIEKTKTKEGIVNNETKMVTDDLQNSGDDKSDNNKLNFEKNQDDIDSIKKWQDAMKSKWLQSILTESEPTDIVTNKVTVNGCLQINTSLSSDKSDFVKDDYKNVSDSSQKSINNKNSSKESQNESEENKKNKLYENIIINSQEQIPKLLVTPKNLSETLERLQSTQLSNQDVHNNRNLVYSSENLITTGSPLSNKKINKDLKQDSRKDNLKLDVNLEDKLHSNRNSRHSSITDSLQDFESSIYDMLQQSAKDSVSDEDDSLVIINAKKNSSNNNNSMKNSRVETAQSC